MPSDDPDDQQDLLATYRAEWEAHFAALPPCYQLWTVEGELRVLLRRLVRLRERLGDPTVSQGLGALLLELEEEIERIDAIAEHSHEQLVSGRINPDGSSELPSSPRLGPAPSLP